MNISKDDWTPLFQSLKSKIAPSSRRQLLNQIIGDIYDISVLNFGESGLARPSEFAQLSEKYAKEWKDGDTTPNLILSREAHIKRNGSIPQMIDSFHTSADSNRATLTNSSPYFEEHQFGKGRMYRPTMPITRDGENLTAFAEERLKQIVQEHFPQV